jgi:hypothetical protein
MRTPVWTPSGVFHFSFDLCDYLKCVNHETLDLCHGFLWVFLHFRANSS